MLSPLHFNLARHLYSIIIKTHSSRSASMSRMLPYSMPKAFIAQQFLSKHLLLPFFPCILVVFCKLVFLLLLLCKFVATSMHVARVQLVATFKTCLFIGYSFMFVRVQRALKSDHARRVNQYARMFHLLSHGRPMLKYEAMQNPLEFMKMPHLSVKD